MCVLLLYTTEPVNMVARYTSAVPMFFNEKDDYVDGGLLANNPCDIGLTNIQNHYRECGKKLPISLMVSITGGKLPEEELGSIDARDFLFFGTHWFKESLIDKTQNLTTLLSNAVTVRVFIIHTPSSSLYWTIMMVVGLQLVESEVVADNCRSHCKEQGILFYCFNPQLEEVIVTGETDSAKFMDMILEARKQIPYQKDFSEMVFQLHNLADASKEVHGSQSVEGSRRKFSKQ